MFIKKIFSLLLVLTFGFLQTMPSFALPSGEDVQSGQAGFTRDGHVLNINQQSDKLITNYQSFSIGSNEAVHFNQPSVSSVALNRVIGSDPSAIMGQLTATGKIFLVNPNGVFFGPSAHVDTAGLVASTMDISNADFLAGKYKFTNPGSGNVINQGSIESPGSFVALLGRHVENAGNIQARLGSVVLASGNQITLNLDPLGLISVSVDEPLKDQISSDDAVKNSGLIHADGGQVIMTAQSLDGLIKNSVNNSGIITAKSLVNKDGKVYLLGSSDHGTVINSGSIDTSAGEPNANGGLVEISGAHLQLGDGKIFTTKNGEGHNGSLLLDPLNFTIDDAWANFFTQQTGSDITVQADQDIDFEITGGLLNLTNLTTETFLVHAGHNIDQNGVTIATHGGNIKFLADTGDISLSAPLESNGGNVDVEATQGNVTHSNLANVMTIGGNFRGYAGKDYVVNNGAMINTVNGVIDLYAGRNLILGTPGNSDSATFTWKYIVQDRSYSFTEFGYYYFVGNTIVYVPIVQGPDIGKDGITPLSGQGTVINTNGFGFYTKFERGTSTYFHPGDDSGTDHWTYYSNPALNENGNNHLEIIGTDYGWEDTYNLGDHDFNDAVMDFALIQSPLTQGVTLTTNTNMFLTADQGSIAQAGGTIHADQLAVLTNTGMSGTAANGGLITDVNHLSALNKTSGDVIFSNTKTLNITNQTGLTGLNNGVAGHNGINNQAPDGKIDLAVAGSLLMDAPISSKGDISLQADDDITHSANAVITIDNGTPIIGPPTDVQSSSHQENVWSNNPDIDVNWRLPDMPQGTRTFTATAGGSYTMAPGSKIVTDNGQATIHADGDVKLTLVDAGNAPVNITSDHGSILDNDLGGVPTDYDVIARSIHLSAPNGSVGQPGPGGEIDEGHPYSFSLLFDENPSTSVDPLIDPYTATVDSSGNWLFSMTFSTPHDSNGWFFHVATQDIANGLSSSTVHTGPYLIDTIAPVITASFDADNLVNAYGWYNHDVKVDFNATDERSGFAPAGALNASLASKTSSGEGSGLIITSDGIFDRAGNKAVPVNVNVNVDKTAPVITASYDPANAAGWYNHDVAVNFQATDNLSGFIPNGALTTPLASKTSTGEGTGLVVTSDGIFDRAGNKAEPVELSFNVDKTAPVITATYDPANAAGWYNHDVAVNFQATDNLSGFNPGGVLNTSLAPKTSSGEGTGLVITSDGIFDRAGNKGVPIDVLVNVDKTAPVIHSGTPEGTPGPGGTFVSDVTIPFTATDNLSGFAPSGSTNTNLPSKTTSGTGNNLTVTSDTVTDLAGNTALPVSAGPFTVTTGGNPNPPTEPPTNPPTVPPGNPTTPTGPIPDLSNITDNNLDNAVNLYRVYYEILKPSQFLSFEPALKIGLFAYHPLTQTENKAGDMNLDIGAYEFIENNIQLKNKKPVSVNE